MQITINIPTNLKRAWDENPIAVIAVAAAAAASAAKLIDSVSGVQSRRAYARKMEASSSKK